MPGTGTVGKLFLKKFLTDFGKPETATAERKQTRRTRWKSLVYRLRLASEMPSRQENNPARAAATARRVHRVPAG
jgi:hypothetical protein